VYKTTRPATSQFDLYLSNVANDVKEISCTSILSKTTNNISNYVYYLFVPTSQKKKSLQSESASQTFHP